MRRLLRPFGAPTFQVGAAGGIMVAGAALIALWAVGLVLIAFGALVAVDGLLRDSGGRPADIRQLHTHDDVLERYRRAP